MKFIQATSECLAAYFSLLASLLSGKMMLDDQSDLPPHLRRENLE